MIVRFDKTENGATAPQCYFLDKTPVLIYFTTSMDQQVWRQPYCGANLTGFSTQRHIMTQQLIFRSIMIALVLASTVSFADTEQRSQDFTGDPIWEEVGNSTAPQDFGLSVATQQADGAAPGEAGGYIERGTQSWYADPRLGELDLTVDVLTATGTMMLENAGNPSFGYFDSNWTGGEYPPSALIFRIDDNNVYLRWESPSNSNQTPVGSVAYGTPFTFALTYDPVAAGGSGVLSLSLDGADGVELQLSSGVKQTLTLDRFGLFSYGESAGHGCYFWIDDLNFTVQQGVATPTPAPTPTPTPLHVAVQRTESFDDDPQWHAHNNRTTNPGIRTTTQNFGYNRWTANAGGVATGELGGFIQPAAEPAYYAKVLSPLTFNDTLSASGKFSITDGHTGVQANIGFFNADTAYGWRTPDSILIRILARGDFFWVYAGYGTGLYRAGENVLGAWSTQTQKIEPIAFDCSGAIHAWSLFYDPNGNSGGGTIAFILDSETVVVNLDPGHKSDGATINRFGLLNMMKSNDSGGNLWLDDVTINGVTENFDGDPQWDTKGNRTSYSDSVVRPRFDFGYSDTNYAGEANGELGGVVFRGDYHYPDKMAYYGDRLETLKLDYPLKASGKVCLSRGISDSSSLIGWFHSQFSLENDVDTTAFPQNFLGIMVEGPSAEGFYFRPVYRVHSPEYGYAPSGPHILPTGVVHDWTLDYSPEGGQGKGSIRVTLDGQSVDLDLDHGDKETGADFDRFGIVTTIIDGHYQFIYFDDLSYTYMQAPTAAANRDWLLMK